METTAFIAGWAPNKPAQLRYVKKAAIATLVATRVVDSSSNDPFVESSLMTPEMFHGITLQPRPAKQQEQYQTFLKKFEQLVSNPAHTPEEARRHLRNSKRHAFWKFAEKCPVVAHEAYQSATKNADWAEKRQRSRILHDAFSKAGREFVMKEVSAHPERSEEWARKISQFIERDKTYRRIERQSAATSTKREGSRKRERWTEEETKILLECKESGMSWKEISNKIPRRTNVDCKDKFRNVKGKKV